MITTRKARRNSESHEAGIYTDVFYSVVQRQEAQSHGLNKWPEKGWWATGQWLVAGVCTKAGSPRWAPPRQWWERKRKRNKNTCGLAGFFRRRFQSLSCALCLALWAKASLPRPSSREGLSNPILGRVHWFLTFPFFYRGRLNRLFSGPSTRIKLPWETLQGGKAKAPQQHSSWVHWGTQAPYSS